MQRSALYRSRREVSNAYLLAKFRFDTAENEPCQVCPIEGPQGRTVRLEVELVHGDEAGLVLVQLVPEGAEAVHVADLWNEEACKLAGLHCKIENTSSQI